MEKQSLRDKICVVITTLCGIGYVPILGGTVASSIAVFVFFLLKNHLYFFILTVVSIVLALSLSGRAEKIFAQRDSQKIIIDDFSGMLLSFLFIPYSFKIAVAGFFFFRFFDVLKIPPANLLDEQRGAKGIVGDDIVAGIYTNLALRIVKLFI
jgi:phosphatidylglycerophosphatase A